MVGIFKRLVALIVALLLFAVSVALAIPAMALGGITWVVLGKCVGMKDGNPFGLFDMVAEVLEHAHKTTSVDSKDRQQ